MALLELIKLQEIMFRQESPFGAIFVSRRDPATRQLDAVTAETP
jgi:chromatin segregation and condensation protein Rec8/ScpA/Scc1 (kleisin family)